MADMGTKEAAEQWGVSQMLVQKWCRAGKIPNATQDKKVRLGIFPRTLNRQEK